MNPWEEALNDIIKATRKIGAEEVMVKIVSKSAIGDIPEIKKQLEKLLPQRR